MRRRGTHVLLLSLLVAGIALLGSQASHAISVLLLGDQMVEPKADSNPAGVAEAFQTTAAATGSVAKLTVYVDTGSTATSLTAGLYADNAGHPGALLGQGTLNAPTAGAWNDVSLPGVPVMAGTSYWIALLSPSGTLNFRDRCCGGGSASETSSQRTLTTLPADVDDRQDIQGRAALGIRQLRGHAGARRQSREPLVRASVGGPNPAPQSFGISNGGGGTLSWSVASRTRSWLSLSPDVRLRAGDRIRDRDDRRARGGHVLRDDHGQCAGRSGDAADGQRDARRHGARQRRRRRRRRISRLRARPGSTVALSWDALRPTTSGSRATTSIARRPTGFTPSRANQIGQSTDAVVRGHGPRRRHLLLPRCRRGRGRQHQRDRPTRPRPPSAAPPQPVYLVGDQTIEARTDHNAAGIAEAFKTTAAATGTRQRRSRSSSTRRRRRRRVTAGVYADTAGHPGALLAQGTLERADGGRLERRHGPVGAGHGRYDLLDRAARARAAPARCASAAHGAGGSRRRDERAGDPHVAAGDLVDRVSQHRRAVLGLGRRRRTVGAAARTRSASGRRRRAGRSSRCTCRSCRPATCSRSTPGPTRRTRSASGTRSRARSSRCPYGAEPLLLGPRPAAGRPHADRRRQRAGGRRHQGRDALRLRRRTRGRRRAGHDASPAGTRPRPCSATARCSSSRGDNIVDFGLPYSPPYFKEASQNSLPEVYDPATNTLAGPHRARS